MSDPNPHNDPADPGNGNQNGGETEEDRRKNELERLIQELEAFRNQNMRNLTNAQVRAINALIREARREHDRLSHRHGDTPNSAFDESDRLARQARAALKAIHKGASAAVEVGEVVIAVGEGVITIITPGPGDDIAMAVVVIGKLGTAARNANRAKNAWNKARKLYWKAQAKMNPKKYNPKDLKRMKEGLAPQRINPKTGKLESKELHHKVPQRDGGSNEASNVVEVWPDEHQAVDPFRRTGN